MEIRKGRIFGGKFRAFDFFRGLFAFIIYQYVKNSFDKISSFKA